MSKADITVFVAPTYIIVEYDNTTCIVGSKGHLPLTLFSDFLQIKDQQSGETTHEFYHVDERHKRVHLPFFCRTYIDRIAEEKGLKVEYIDLKVQEGVDVTIPMIDGFKPKSDVQAGAIAHATDSTLGPRRPVALQPGCGKALESNTLVKTPGGWRRIGSLSVGDLVIAKDGTPTEVTGVYPQGFLPGIHVIFDGGRTLCVNEEHLWGCYVDNGVYQVLTTKQIRHLVSVQKRRVSIPVVTPEAKPDIELGPSPEALDVLEASPKQKRAYLESLITQRLSHTEYLSEVDLDDQNSVIKIAHSLGYMSFEHEGGVYWSAGHNTVGISLFLDTGSPVDMTCISVAHPDKLFVVKDYIVTHNTVTLIDTASILGKRAFVQMAGNIDQWVGAVLKWTKCDPEDIYVLKGAASIRRLVLNIDEINPKFILASTRTVVSHAEFSDKHEETLVQNGLPRFDDLFDHFGVGVWCLDEYHYNIEANFQLGLRLKAPVIVPMTATFLNANPKILAIMDKQYPPQTRFGYGKYHKYVHICAVRFTLKAKMSPFVYRGAKGYMHSGVEDHIRRKHMEPYMRLVIWPIFVRTYLSIKNPGEKFLILATTVEFVDDIVSWMQKILKEEGIDLRIGALYGGVDEEDVKLSSDILVGTLKKAGTGSDIPDLRSMLNTVAVKSITENEQNLGRLREMKDRSIDPIYSYLTWDDIPPQVEYFLPRMKHYTRLGKTFNILRVGIK